MQPPSAPKPRGGRLILFAVLAILLSLLATAVIGEGVLRLAGYSPTNVNPLKSFHEFDPLIGWRGRKDYTARFKRPDFDVLVAQDAAGFRKQVNLEPKLNKAPHSVFVFGDSFVWGWGVGQGEVFTDRMNLLLPDYSVHNYGINGVGTVVEYELFSAEVRKSVRPGDVVVLMFCNNDYADNVDRSKFHAEAANGEVKTVNPAKRLTSPLQDWIKNHSYLCNYVWYRADLYRVTRVNRTQEDEALGRTISETDERFTVTKYFLAKFQADCEAAKARFIVAHIPSQEELSESRTQRPNRVANEKARTETLSSITRALHIETIDLLPGFLARKNKTGDTLTFRNDGHWNPTGHQAVAELLSEYLSTHPATNSAPAR
jgi:lysophospholipase L1-like esterase